MNFQTVFIGTYTEKSPFVDGKAEGIYFCRLDLSSGELVYLSNTVGPRNPSYLAIDPQKKFIYATQETAVEDGHKVHIGGIDGDSLESVNNRHADGGLTWHITVDRTGKYGLGANYETGSIDCYTIREIVSLVK